MLAFLELGKWGRTGNEMWQIAAVIGIAKANGHSYCFPKWEQQGHFKNPLPQCEDVKNYKALHEKGFSYSSLKVDGGNYDLKGYFQSNKYWKDIDVLPYFEFLIEYVQNEHVGVHIRRGDYLEKSNYHTNLSLDYYKKAMCLFPGKTFVIFSDDVNWCRENFKGQQFLFSEGKLPIQDLQIMSECSHQIIANSSFSWWAQKLNKNPDKIVVAPRKNQWFGPDGPKNVDDLYLNTWKLI